MLDRTVLVPGKRYSISSAETKHDGERLHISGGSESPDIRMVAMDPSSILLDMGALRDRPGCEERFIVIGSWCLAVTGLQRRLAEELDSCWGAFLAREPTAEPRLRLNLFVGGEHFCLRQLKRAEEYRIEAEFPRGVPLLRSYGFAACPDKTDRSWRIALNTECDEPPARTLENAVRSLVARAAIEDGGFAMHAAGVLKKGRAFLFAGKSNSGKTTVVSLSRPCSSLGDDYGVVLPDGESWSAPAVPFDNSGIAPAATNAGLHRVAGVWRLFKSSKTRIERPGPAMLEPSLLACTTYPWIMPDLMERLLDQVRSFSTVVRYEHLHFRPDPGFWDLILPE